MTAKVNTKYTSIIPVAAFKPDLTLSSRLAPMFWPQYVAMATPMFSNTVVNTYFTLMEAVKAATYMVPSALLALCSMITPIPVIENCSPIGMPLFSRCVT